MTKKAVVCVFGVADGTTLLNLVTMNKDHKFYPENGWWLWCVNPANVLNLCARMLGAPPERDNDYFEFISETRASANKNFDYDNVYIDDMVTRFGNDEKVDLLYVYGISEDRAKELQEDVGAFTLMVSSAKSNKDFTPFYDKVLKWDDDNFTNDVVDFLTVLTEDEVKEKTE